MIAMRAPPFPISQDPAATARTPPAERPWPLLPWVLLPAAAAVIAGGTAIDSTLADAIFAWEGHRWALRDDPITRGLLHDGGLMACRLAWSAVVLAWAATFIPAGSRRLRQPLAHNPCISLMKC